MHNTMPTGDFELVPLSDFTVTVRTPRDDLRRVRLFVWLDKNDVKYKIDYSMRVVYIKHVLPDDINPVLDADAIEAGWQLKWNHKL